MLSSGVSDGPSEPKVSEKKRNMRMKLIASVDDGSLKMQFVDASHCFTAVLSKATARKFSRQLLDIEEAHIRTEQMLSLGDFSEFAVALSLLKEFVTRRASRSFEFRTAMENGTVSL